MDKHEPIIILPMPSVDIYYFLLARLTGFEPAVFRVGVEYSIL